MTEHKQTEVFGQAVAEPQLRPLTRGIVARINDGKPASRAGFVWYRPQGLFQEKLHRMEEFPRAA